MRLRPPRDERALTKLATAVLRSDHVEAARLARDALHEQARKAAAAAKAREADGGR